MADTDTDCVCYGISYVVRDGMRSWEGCESGYYHGPMDDEGNFVDEVAGPFPDLPTARADAVALGFTIDIVN